MPNLKRINTNKPNVELYLVYGVTANAFKQLRIKQVTHLRMKTSCALIVSTLLLAPIANAQQAAPINNVNTCIVESVSFDQSQLMSEGHVKVEADRTEIIENTIALFSGDVIITSDTAIISAQEAQVSENGENLTASGDVEYRDVQLTVQSDSVSLSSDNAQLSMENTRYKLAGLNGRGNASDIILNQNVGLQLNEVSFTTCPLGGEDWKIQASEISIEPGSIWGQAKHTRFYVGNVPVFYLPYFAFPISNQRQTGFLFPNISSSARTGVDYEQPFYWNLAPNYDMTISPRLMTLRGIQLKTEFRYMSTDSMSVANVEYLPSDQDIDSSPDRYFYRLQHQGVIWDNWLLNVDFNGLSDDNYLVDLGSDFYNRSDTHLYKTVSLSYYSESLSVNMHVRDFEVLGDATDSYRALPEIKLSYQTQLSSMLEFDLDSEIAYFDSNAGTLPSAARLHVAPTLSVPIRRAWGEVSAEATLMSTLYQQNNVEGTELDESVTRNLGQVRLFGALYFEKEGSWLSQSSRMTLEPKLQYLYTSFEDQSNIGLYDSTLLITDVEGLFRGQEFTGLDRISDNDQITVGLTSRVIDENNREQFALSLGQIFYLSDSKVVAAQRNRDRSALAAEMDWRIGGKWFLHSDVQVSTDNDKVDLSSVGVEYREDANRFIQMTHRYVRNLSNETIEQVGLSASWPIAKDWQWVGRAYRDLEGKRSIESYFGVQYESCCWAIRLVAQRSLSNRYNNAGEQTTNEFDSGVSLQFIFKGIGSQGTQRSMLADGMFGYRQPYSLN